MLFIDNRGGVFLLGRVSGCVLSVPPVSRASCLVSAEGNFLSINLRILFISTTKNDRYFMASFI
jgi:hypothetical protein